MYGPITYHIGTTKKKLKQKSSYTEIINEL